MSENKFKINSKFKPKGDQPQAIKKLVKGLEAGKRFQTLLGVTGSGKTFTIANVIEKVQKPTLVIAPNKTLTAQLAQEFRTFFPKSAVEYFVSYYDYYQPEAYIASSDTYIEKESQINDEIDRLRHAATSALLTRRDVIICASVSCIYGLGSPEYYRDISLELVVGAPVETQNFASLPSRDEIIKKLIDMQYVRSDILARGKFRLTGNTLEIITLGREVITRIILENNSIKKISEYDFLTGEELGKLERTLIYPAKHFVVPEPIMKESLNEIEKEMMQRVEDFKKKGKILEAERILRRTRQDIEMMKEIGYCNGIENYSRYLSGRGEGEAPYTLIDYFNKNFLLVIDESHVTIPQLNGMFSGDYSRKTSLVENGFRLPSAFDNRPLKFAEFEKKINQSIFVSATPGKYELEKCRERKFAFPTENKGITEQIIRPTGLIDPEIEIRPARGQVKDVMKEIEKIVARKEPASIRGDHSSTRGGRVLITALTKKQAEDLAEFLKESTTPHQLNKNKTEDLDKDKKQKKINKENNDQFSWCGGKIKSEYLHSGVDTLDRIRILEKLRRGEIDVLVGVNLLREGLDLPEVSLVAIFDADKEGFLRSETSLIQTIGRAARNVRGKVILYADNLTGSMKRAISETNRRRKLQTAYNKKHHITPRTIEKKIQSIVDHEIKSEIPKEFINLESLENIAGYIKQREKEMKDSARNLEFEKATIIRDEIGELRKLQIE